MWATTEYPVRVGRIILFFSPERSDGSRFSAVGQITALPRKK